MKREKGGMNDTQEETGTESLHVTWTLVMDGDRLQAGEEIGYECNRSLAHILYVQPRILYVNKRKYKKNKFTLS